MGYRLIIFDFDGTLADSAAWFAGALNGVARRYGFREIDLAEMARLRNKYKQHLEHVDRLFPTVDELARSTGLRNDENEYGKAPESYQEVHRRKPAKG